MFKPTIYPFICGSGSRPESSWIGFGTEQEAQRHCNAMNAYIEEYDHINSSWNYSTWPEKPLPWAYKPNPRLEELTTDVEATSMGLI